MRALAALVVAAMIAGCTPPPPSAYVAVSSGNAGTVVGSTAGGDECRFAAGSGGGDVWCGTWRAPSARVRATPDTTASAVAAAGLSALTGRLTCAAPRATTVLGGEPAMLAECRMRNGGWPAFVLAAAPGGHGYLADGVLPALPAAERAIGVASGRIAPDAAPPSSQALDLMARRLAQEAFTTGDIGRYEALMTVGRDANQAERFASAETAYRAALALQERLLGADQPDSWMPVALLALQLSNQGRTPEADQLFRRAERLAPRAADPLAPASVIYYAALAQANQQHADQALAGFARAEALYLPYLPPELRGGAAASLDRGAALAPLLVTRDVLPDPLTQRAVVGVIEARRNAADVLRRSGRIAEAQAKVAAAGRLAAAVPGITGADLIVARVDRTRGAIAASAGAAGTAQGDFAASAARFARGAPRSRPYAETLLLRATSLPAGAAEVRELCREAVATLRALREGTSARLVAPCVDAFVADPSDQSRLADGFAAAQLAQGNVTTTQIARAAARLAEGARDPRVGSAIARRDETLRALAARYRERDAAVAEGRNAADLSALDARIAAAEADANEADSAVQAAAPGFAQLVQSVVPARDVFAAMGPGEALLLTTLPPNRRGWNFLLRDGRISVAPVSEDTASVTALVRTLRASVEDGAGEKPFAAEAAWRLHQALLGGFGPELAGVKDLLVVPTDALMEIPYGILVTRQPPAPQGHAGNSYLLEQFAVTHLPAAASLVALNHAGVSAAPHPWAGFGAPRPIAASYAAHSFPAAPGCGRELAALPALPGAEVELNLAARIMGDGAARPVTGTAFTAGALTHADLHQFRVLHFATHGVLPSDLACLAEPVIIASTATTGPDAAQALIGASTVLNLNLDADLVIVSACNSGGGAAAGESLSTLARAFFFAGARGLLLTHWYINDVAAARVGATMLLNMRKGQDTAEALRAAQLDLLHVKEASHPALWGPFALVGTAGRRPGST
jgi:CHAT domain-containing protein